MPYTATVVNVMLASPSDVVEEWSIGRDVIDQWNVDNSHRSALILKSLGWDRDASPELGQRPQSIINGRVLERADVLVAIFHTRIGTPTGEAESGTVEEINRHVAAGKLAMLYFSDVPTPRRSVDDQQWARLEAFRKDVRTRGLVEGYSSHDEFRQKFRRQLHDQIMQRFGSLTPREPGGFGGGSPAKLDNVALSILFYSGTAPKNSTGYVRARKYLQGTSIIAGNTGLDSASPRSAAKWRAGIESLVDAGMLTPTNAERTFFTMTAAGYHELDRLQAIGFQPLPSEAPPE